MTVPPTLFCLLIVRSGASERTVVDTLDELFAEVHHAQQHAHVSAVEHTPGHPPHVVPRGVSDD